MFTSDILAPAGAAPTEQTARAVRLFRLPNPDYALAEVERRYADRAEAIEKTRGLAMTFRGWRFTLRPIAHEPGLSLTVESGQGDTVLERRSAEMAGLLASC